MPREQPDQELARDSLGRQLDQGSEEGLGQRARRRPRQALDDGSIMFNPREVTLEDALSVLRRAWA